MLLAAYATGIAMVHLGAPHDATGLSVTFGLLFLTWVLLRRSRWATLPLLGILLLAGHINATRELSPPAQENHISRFAEGQPLAVEARVLSVEQRSMNGYRLVAETLRVFETSGIRRVLRKGFVKHWPRGTSGTARSGHPLAVKVTPTLRIRQPWGIRLSFIPCVAGDTCDRLYLICGRPGRTGQPSATQDCRSGKPAT